MVSFRSRSVPVLFVALAGWACADVAEQASTAVDESAQPSPYLYIWAGDADASEGDSDFLAVVDTDPESPEYGSILGSAPVGSVGNDPHHAEPIAPGDGLLFANGFEENRTFLFDLSKPTAPAFVRELDPIDGYSYVHSFLRLESGHVLATVQNGDGSQLDDVGGLAEFDADGDLMRVTSAVDDALSIPMIRPYALEVFPGSDRVVTSSFAMSLERSANAVQIWRLSDLTLLHTIMLPEVPAPEAPECFTEELATGGDCAPARVPGHDRPFEVRRLADGSALLNTIPCAFYRISELDAEEPRVEVVMNWPEEFGCMVPSIAGDFYVIPKMWDNQLISIDVSDPTAPVEVDRITMEGPRMPHWLQVDPGTHRVVVTGVGPEGTMVRIYHVDPETGALSLDENFEAAFTMDREEWPHGATGPAAPHAALFGR